jgi:alpha-1,3-rhamnosyl/mannosyltransferase
MSRRVALQMHRLDVPNPTGVHRYAHHIAAALAATAGPDDDIELWSGAPVPAGITAHAWPVPRRLLHASWLAVHAPRADRFTGPVSLWHQLTPALPLPTRAPLVVTVHDVLPLQQPQWYSRFARTTVVAALRFAARHAAGIITPSRAVARDVIEVLGVDRERISVVPEGVDRTFVAEPEPHAVRAVCEQFGVIPGQFVLTLGAIGPRKNVETLIEALATVPPEVRPILLVAGADGGSLGALRQRAEATGTAGQVRWAGRVCDTDLTALLHGAAGLAHPSRYEGFGLPVLEAMAAGTPVLAAAAGALPELVADGGVLIDPDDIAGWAAALVRLVADEAWAAGLASRGRYRTEPYTWPAAARTTWRAYDEVLAGRPGIW